MHRFQPGLRAKLLAMTSVTIVTIGFVAGVYFLLSNQIEASSRDAAEAARHVDILSETRTSALSLLSVTEAFVILPTADRAAVVSTEARGLEALLPTLAEEPDVQSAMQSMPGTADGVVDAQVNLGLNQNEGLQGSLRASVHGVEHILSEQIEAGLNLDGIMVEMLMLRRNEKDFMLRKDPKYITSFAERIATFKALVPASTLPAVLKAEIDTATDAYAADFDKYATGLLGLTEAIAQFETAVANASAVIDAALAEAQQRGDTAQAQLSDMRTNMSVALLATFAIATIAALLIAFVVARSISRPIAGMTRAMGQLAEGRLDVDIPVQKQRDEIGDMAAAVEIFKQNAIRVSEMGAEEAIRASRNEERNAAGAALIAALAEVVDQAVAGDFSGRVEADPRYDDLMAVARGVNNLVETVDAGIGDTVRVLGALARMDLSKRMDGAYQGAFAQLQTDTNAVSSNLGEIVGQLRNTSGSVKAATGEILVGANDLAERTTKQAAAIEQTSAAMEQLAQIVSDNATRADSASGRARAVSETASQTGEVMEQSTAAMQRITESAARISSIIGLIDDIAFQTNLLALNASVEAARAGDAGNGFAVVAVEVRRLAQSAAQASSEIKGLIEQSAGEVASGSRLVADASQKLSAMLEGVRESARLIEGIATANREQANSIAEVTTAVRQMDEMTQHNAALVEQTNAAIEQTESQAVELDRIISVFVIEEATSSAEPPAARKATGIKALQEKVMSAAKSYIGGGTRLAANQGWDAF